MDTTDPEINLELADSTTTLNGKYLLFSAADGDSANVTTRYIFQENTTCDVTVLADNTAGRGIDSGASTKPLFNYEDHATGWYVCFRSEDTAGNVTFKISDEIDFGDYFITFASGADTGLYTNDYKTNDTTPTFTISGYENDDVIAVRASKYTDQTFRFAARIGRRPIRTQISPARTGDGEFTIPNANALDDGFWKIGALVFSGTNVTKTSYQLRIRVHSADPVSLRQRVKNKYYTSDTTSSFYGLDQYFTLTSGRQPL